MTYVFYSVIINVMPRVIFPDDTQLKFLQQIKDTHKVGNKDLAFICNVSRRTLSDWVRGKYSISEKAFNILSQNFDIKISEEYKIVDDYWYVEMGAKLGAEKRLALHGQLGTPEGRKKGGTNSQIRRKEDPEKYRLLGCNIRKDFKINEKTTEFAEATGIILGDGAITNTQLRITVSSLVDRPYALFIQKLFLDIFKEKPSLIEYSYHHVLGITISGVGLVEELENWGFIRGDKVRNQVDFPAWIWENIEFQKACVRGLMDTDGGCYFHKHKSNGLTYRNFGMSFANESLPIVQSVGKVLKSLGLKFSFAKHETRIYIYSLEEIKKYFALIGSNNKKNNEKFHYYLNQKTHRCEL